jgi:transposase
MLTVEDHAQIRLAARDGESIRGIAKRLHRSRRKVREAIAEAEPRPYTRRKEPAAPKLGPFTARIDEILAADEQAPRKQRHTATQVFRRLVQESYAGGYDQVRRYIRRKRRRARETFIPLVHAAGQRAEADFGHIYVDFPEGRRQVPVLIVTWAYSYCPFAIALPTERTEAVLHGLVRAFEFFGSVPQELWWDNPTTVAVTILAGRQRKLNLRYAALASHYNFEPLFCMPARGNEKPHVENRVKDLERRWATPVPKVQDLEELNAYLRQCCLADRQRVATGQTQTIGERFAQERVAALPLPVRPFDACLAEPRQVDKYQTILFDHNRYSVPHAQAFCIVTVKAYVERIEVVASDQVIATHGRSYQRGQQVLDPRHYLVTLGRKPACLDHSAVYRQWQLPESFTALRQTLEATHGSAGGARHFIRVLQLLQEHPVQHVAQAIEICQCRDGSASLSTRITHAVERVHRQVEWQTLGAPDESPRSGAACELALADHVPRVHVPLPDLRRFDQLLSSPIPEFASGEPTHAQDDVSGNLLAVAVEPQAVATAHHAG